MRAAVISRMEPDAWERVRTIRLRALADTPDAFGMTLAEELESPPEQWRLRLASRDAATFVATADGRDVGLVVGAGYDGEPGAAGLFAMWVDPAFRGRGVGRALVDAVIDWARQGGFDRVLLDVADGNAAAIGLYERAGFTPTGRVGTLPPPRDHVPEHQRSFRL